MKLLKSLMCQIQSHPKKGSRKITMVIKRFLTCDSFLKSNVFTGVDNDRFLGRRASPATVAAISKSNEEEDFESREAIYDARRAEIQYQFRYCNNYKACLKSCLPGPRRKIFMIFAVGSFWISGTFIITSSMSPRLTVSTTKLALI